MYEALGFALYIFCLLWPAWPRHDGTALLITTGAMTASSKAMLLMATHITTQSAALPRYSMGIRVAGLTGLAISFTISVDSTYCTEDKIEQFY